MKIRSLVAAALLYCMLVLRSCYLKQVPDVFSVICFSFIVSREIFSAQYYVEPKDAVHFKSDSIPAC